jgi:hypothetical protein
MVSDSLSLSVSVLISVSYFTSQVFRHFGEHVCWGMTDACLDIWLESEKPSLPCLVIGTGRIIRQHDLLRY